MTYHFKNPSDFVIASYLKNSRTIAVVGLSSRPDTTSYQVSQVMQQAGYKIIPINPRVLGQEILGEPVYASLADVPDEIDIVNVFRRSEFLPEVAQDFIKTDAKIFWAQLGLENEEAEAILRKAGRDKIVMNRCIKVEYQKLQD